MSGSTEELEDEFEDELEGSLEEEQDESGFARTYTVELLYKEKPVLDKDVLYAKMQAYTGDVQRPDEDDKEQTGSGAEMPVWEANDSGADSQLTYMFFHMNHMVEYADGSVPAQTCVFAANEISGSYMYETALQQSWHWPEVRETVDECRHSLLLTDFCAAGLDYKERLQLFQNALRALLETAPCDAIYWKTSEKFIQPQAYTEAVAGGQLLHGALNIRFYSVEGTGSGRQEALMDTCGLAALGIPDVQCHFYDLSPNEVADSLNDLAYYLFDKGNVIQDGETVGMTGDQRWRCEHQFALAVPQRYVIDLDPGEPYYAGKQHHDEAE
ncbi:DUF4261 domain-containing protein [Paenibacillus eucommiae]|uniref:DUF4261 domain-containing protein n=1 Tax=Paenibacillus eucommiae TaxID=1355755 RepID=A0ABS4IX88_9BACL|nr:DUF4261 domain-containing protein [Paenibacillus eucommiae]MBP1991496.1 hypothetical protein [Paenibacillus eucommiae]